MLKKKKGRGDRGGVFRPVPQERMSEQADAAGMPDSGTIRCSGKDLATAMTAIGIGCGL